MAQTENPRNGRWNKPKKSTYTDGVLLMYLNEDEHIKTTGFSITWGDEDQYKEFKAKYWDYLDDFQKDQMRLALTAAECRKYVKVEIVRIESDEQRAEIDANNKKFEEKSKKLFAAEYMRQGELLGAQVS